MNEKEHIAYAKRELQNHRYLTLSDKKLSLEAESIYTRLMNVKSPSAPREDGGGTVNPYLRAELFDRLEEIKTERKDIRKRLNRIDDFMNKLSTPNKNTLYHVYMACGSKQKTLEEEATHRFMSRRTLVRYIDDLLVDF